MVQLQHRICLVMLFAFVTRLVAENQVEGEIKNNCKCVRPFQCDKSNVVIEDGATLIEPRIGDGKGKPRIKCKGGNYEGYYVCCRLESNLAIQTKNPENVVVETNDNKINCGVQRPVISDRIFATDESGMYPLPGEFPWIAAVFLKNKNKQYEFSFSGSLIHGRVILTAAHKVHRKRESDLKVVVNGELDLPVIGNNTQEEREVKEIILHEDYNNLKLYNDVALLILKEPYTISKRHLNRICLPPDSVNMEGKQCIVAGWGKEINPNGEPKVLKKVTVPFVERNTCQELLRRTQLGGKFRLDKSFLCAGGEKDEDACQGDGGSPLMCPYSPGKARYFQAGIVVGGVGCGQENVPGIYGNVEEFKEWIKNKLSSRNINID